MKILTWAVRCANVSIKEEFASSYCCIICGRPWSRWVLIFIAALLIVATYAQSSVVA